MPRFRSRPRATTASFLILFPLLLLTPNFVPLDLLTGPRQTLARINPVSYVSTELRELVLVPNIQWGPLGACVLTIVLSSAVHTGLSLRSIATSGE
jgi:hypothetical protein